VGSGRLHLKLRTLAEGEIMKKSLWTMVWIVFSLSAMVAASPAAAANGETLSTPTDQGAVTAQPDMYDQMGPGMMGPGGRWMNPGWHGMGNRHCMGPSRSWPGRQGMGRGYGGAMMGHGLGRHLMRHGFFLNRAGELGLSDVQVNKLQAIRSACLKDNIRMAAEVKIDRLNLQDLLHGENWTVEEGEKLIRKMEKQKADMMVRHLRALAEARKVLTPEQLKKAETHHRWSRPIRSHRRR
jgi:Spy/CpxP family protein refolding chaperone